MSHAGATSTEIGQHVPRLDPKVLALIPMGPLATTDQLSKPVRTNLVFGVLKDNTQSAPEAVDYLRAPHNFQALAVGEDVLELLDVFRLHPNMLAAPLDELSILTLQTLPLMHDMIVKYALEVEWQAPR